MNSYLPVDHGLTEQNILQAFPAALAGDASASALAEITARLLARRPEEIDQLRIYPDIGRLDEQALDILAYDFKVDWWDPEYSLEEKRRIFKESWYVHKHLGTRAAVETALRAIYPKAEVQEWFQYGGKPYFFRLSIDLTGELSDAARPWRVMERVNFYKSLRSHVDEIVFNFILPAYTLHVGGSVGAWASIGVPQEPDVYDFRDTLRVGGTFGSLAELPVPEDTARPAATTILRTGAVCTIISYLSQGE